MSLNKEYQARAHKYIPAGAHTYSRGDDQYPINAPTVLEKGEGVYVWDMDGNRYIDYGMALRAVTVGYANKRIAEAAIKQIYNGNNLTRASKVEVDAAELLVDLIDSADMVKFAKNGSTVTTAAIKLSRAYTGKKYIARCAQHPFFSYDDWFIGTTIMEHGVPEENKALTLMFDFNDIYSLEKLFDEYNDDIAAVILEPATTIEPKDDYLNKVKKLCEQRKSVFILDEMITGFRWDLKGAQNYYKVQPDLCTFGKGMANGFSVAALAGKKEIMELGGIINEGAERVFLISTTHGAEMCSLGAFIETINVYKELDVVGHLWSYGNKLLCGMNQISKSLGISEYFRAEGVPVSPNYICLGEDGQASFSYRTLFSQEMIKNGVLMPWIAIAYNHNDEILDITLDAVEKSLKIYKKALDEGIDHYLIGRPIKPVFRKYN